jgi:hypothetical protein
MKQRNLLHKFDYKTCDSVQVIDNRNLKKAEDQLPFLEVKVDMEAGRLSMQADSQFIFQNADYTKKRYVPAQKTQVHIQMDILPSAVVDLNDCSNDGRIFSLEGSIIDPFLLNSCVGVLILRNKWHGLWYSDLWVLEFYIYDNSTYYGEIKFDLPLYLTKAWKDN